MKQFVYTILAIILFTSKSNAQAKSKVMEKNKYSIEIIRYDIPQNQWEQFEKAYDSAGKFLSKSKYCLSYSIIKGSEEPNHYVVIIHWTSEDEHLNGFRKSADFMPFFNLVKPFYNQIQEMKHYNELSLWYADDHRQ
jgi:quinol monooxygenase YgiN